MSTSKVGDSYIINFCLESPTYPNDMKHVINTMRWLANPNQGCTHFPRDLWSSFECLK